MEIGEKENIK